MTIQILPVKRLHELCEVTSSKRIYSTELSSSGVPFYRSKDIIEFVNGQEAPSSPLFIPVERFREILKLTGAPVHGDVLLTSRGTLGVPYFVKESNCFHFADGNLTWFRNFRQLDSRYLTYYFLSPAGKAELAKCIIGSSQAAYTIASLKNVEISVPSLSEQRRIAGILSAYDELIENCQRRIKILEQMARGLYRKWFVNFRFPNHAKKPMVDSPLGKIPKGWEVRKLAELVSTQYGYTESSNTQAVGPKYLRGMDINKTSYIDWSEVPYCPITPEDHDQYRLKIGDVLVIRMADPGKVGIVEQNDDAVFASYLIRVCPQKDHLTPYFLFHLMESAEYYAYITGASTGTTRKSASAGVIADYQFVMPPKGLVAQFEIQVGQIRSLLTTLLKQIVNLRKTRDLLLPRLMSGQTRL